MKIGIIDYGAGNLRSVQKALEKCGAQAQILSRPADLSNMDKIVLPGVGAFGHAMASLHKHNLVDPLKRVIHEKVPFLGICLGMQILFEGSDESPGTIGMGLVAGQVRRFPVVLKVPHLGWNQIAVYNNSTLFDQLPEAPFFYFAHSYYIDPVDRAWVTATSNYGQDYAVAVSKGNVHGIQFHPEKSQQNGLTLLSNFVKL